MNVVYEGIRLTPDQIVDSAKKGDVHLVGLSILSGSHISLATDVVDKLKDAGLSNIPVIVGGIIPPEDAADLKNKGVKAVYTPKDFDMSGIMSDMVDIVLETEEAVS